MDNRKILYYMFFLGEKRDFIPKWVEKSPLEQEYFINTGKYVK